MSKRELEIQLYRLSQQIKKCEANINGLEVEVARKVKVAKDAITNLREMEEKISNAASRYRDVCEKDSAKEIQKLQKQLDQALLSGGPQSSASAVDMVTLAKAKTIAIFDSLVFAISNWSTDGQSAPDVELALQSVLFPTVYERVMKGNSDYHITTVPASALEVVKRGRETVRWLRETTDASLVQADVWEEHAGLIQQWLIRDALPLIYGARDPDWDDDIPLSIIEMIEWRDMPASRALHFPLIFDGMDLVEKHGSDIGEFTGLPAFNKQQVTTRIDP